MAEMTKAEIAEIDAALTDDDATRALATGLDRLFATLTGGQRRAFRAMLDGYETDPLPDVAFTGIGISRPGLGSESGLAPFAIRVVDGAPWTLDRDGRPVAPISAAAFRELAAAVEAGMAAE